MANSGYINVVCRFRLPSIEQPPGDRVYPDLSKERPFDSGSIPRPIANKTARVYAERANLMGTAWSHYAPPSSIGSLR